MTASIGRWWGHITINGTQETRSESPIATCQKKTKTSTENNLGPHSRCGSKDIGGIMQETKRPICKYCTVDVISKTDTRAVLGKSHGKHCPRRFK